jgi:CRP-like cAMP-binding protein
VKTEHYFMDLTKKKLPKKPIIQDSKESFDKLTTYLNVVSPISTPEAKRLWDLLEVVEIAKSQHFLTGGSASRKVGIVLEGLLRVYYDTEGGGIFIRNFCPEGSVFGSYSAILETKVADVNIQALEKSIVVVIDFDKFHKFCEDNAVWERFLRRVAEIIYVIREERLYQLAVLNSDQRYKNFMETQGRLMNRLTQGNIAAYLGITAVTLSRLRGQAKQEKV